MQAGSLTVVGHVISKEKREGGRGLDKGDTAAAVVGGRGREGVIRKHGTECQRAHSWMV